MDEYGSTNSVITNDIQRSQLLFGKHSLTHTLYRNIKKINDSDANEGAIYQKWLFENKIPELKSKIENALIDTLMPTGDMELLEKYVGEFQDNLEKFKTLCKREYNERAFLVAYS